MTIPELNPIELAINAVHRRIVTAARPVSLLPEEEKTPACIPLTKLYLEALNLRPTLHQVLTGAIAVETSFGAKLGFEITRLIAIDQLSANFDPAFKTLTQMPEGPAYDRYSQIIATHFLDASKTIDNLDRLITVSTGLFVLSSLYLVGLHVVSLYRLYKIDGRVRQEGKRLKEHVDNRLNSTAN